MGYTLRAAKFGDYEALCALLAEGDGLHSDHLPHFFRRAPGLARSPSYIRSLIADPSVGLFVALDDEALVGCLIIGARQTPDFPILVPRSYAVVEVIVVKETHRGLGIGKQLMSQAEHWAYEQGLEAVELNVFEFNDRARSFYEELGYETVSRRMVKGMDFEA